MTTEILNALKEFGDKHGRAWEEFKSINDDRISKVEKKMGTALDDEALDKINKDLSEFDEKMEALRRKIDAQKWYEKETQKGGATEGQVAYRKAWWESIRCRANKQPVPDEVVETMKQHQPDYIKTPYKSGTTGDGLEWADEDYIMELWRDVVEMSPVVGLVRRYPTSRKSIEIPTHAAVEAGVWVAEAAERVEATNAATGLKTINTFEFSVRYGASRESLEDVVLGLDRIIREDQAEQIARGLGNAIVAGDGSGKPQGFKDATGAQTSGIAENTGIPTSDELIDIYYAIKTSYAERATWLMNRGTIGVVRKIQDANNQYLWVPGFSSAPNTILGRPVVEVADMDAVNDGTGKHSIAFGDWRRAYALADRHGFRALVDPYSSAATGMVDLYGYVRVGGDVVKTEAYVLSNEEA